MANMVNINNVAKSNAENQAYTVKGGAGVAGKLSGNNGREVAYDYSAIKLTDDDKRYRMDIRKQADSLLSAAAAITNRFPPLFTQMITSYNNVRDEIKEITENQSNNIQSGDDIENANTKVMGTPRNDINTVETNTDISAAKNPAPAEQLDVEGIYNVISGFINDINGMMDKVAESGSYTAQSTVGHMVSAIDDFSEELSGIGINYNAESGLEIDRSRLEESIKNGDAEKVLTAEKGFTERIARMARESAQRSDSFIEKTNTGNDNRPAKNTSINYNYITNATIDN